MKYQSQDDYLRTIYLIAEKNKNNDVKSVDVANQLNVSKAAVSKMLKKLQTQGFIFIELYSKINLTKKGLGLAQKLTYKYRIIEVFLVDILHVSRKTLHEVAHKLEHAFSYKTIKKLADFLNNPESCPCGHKIPKMVD